jgi:hypothetical protein
MLNTGNETSPRIIAQNSASLRSMTRDLSWRVRMFCRGYEYPTDCALKSAKILATIFAKKAVSISRPDQL